MTLRTWAEIKANSIALVGFGNAGDAEYERVMSALEFAYNAPPTSSVNLKQAWNDWLDANAPQRLIVNFDAGNAAAVSNQGAIYIDPDFAEAIWYITPEGNAVYHTLNTVMIHELLHAVAGIPDDASESFAGTNTTLVNGILDGLGIPRVAHYWGQVTPADGLLPIPGYSYTGGKTIDVAIVLTIAVDVLHFDFSHKVDTTSFGNQRDLLIGGPAGYYFISGGGEDFLYGGVGVLPDSLVGGDGKDELFGQAGNDVLVGATAQIVNGIVSIDTIVDDDDHDILDGGTGNDHYHITTIQPWGNIFGGVVPIANIIPKIDHLKDADGQGDVTLFGNDLIGGITWKQTADGFVDITSESTYFLIKSGNLLVFSHGDNQGGWFGESYGLFTMDVSFTAPGGLFLGMIFTSQMNSAVGGSVADNLSGSTDNDYMQGLGGNDSISGLSGNDVIEGGDGNDLVNGQSGADNLLGGEGDDQLSGGDDGDQLRGGNGNDSLDGGNGNDLLVGDAGNDTYIVNSLSDTVREYSSDGIDVIHSSVSMTALADDIENLVLTGTLNLNASGNSLDNRLTGNTGINQLSGGLGYDIYVVQNSSDIVVESFDGGLDTVEASVSYAIGGEIEYLMLTGTNNINGTGNTLNNIIRGNSGNNTLDGGTG